MKSIFILFALMTGVVVAGITQVVSDFEGGTRDGWTADGDGNFYWENGYGNPGACMRLDDDATGDMNRSYAPLKFLGNWSAATGNDTLRADIFLHRVTTTWVTTNYLFRITGPGGQATAIINPHPGPDVWTNYKISLAQSDWQLNYGTWSGLLQHVTELIVTLEFIDGDEYNRLDNVKLSFTPGLMPVVPSLCNDFEDGTYQGWSFTGTGTVSNQSSGGSPGRYLSIANNSSYTGYGYAPSKFLGIWTGLDNHAAEIVFDLRVTTTGALQTTDAFLRISGPGGAAKIATTSNLQGAFGQWCTFTYPIMEAAWTIESGTWSQILAQVDELRICVEFSSASETVSIDDFCISNIPPVADFTSDYTRIFAGDSIHFYDRSDKVPTAWAWTFGDSGTGAVEKPVHTYPQPGFYDVGLTVTNHFGSDTKLVNGYIEVVSNDECLKYSDDFPGTTINQMWRLLNGTWSVSGGVMRQTSNDYGPTVNDGCYALTGSVEWSDYYIASDLYSTDDDQIGLVFNYHDMQNMYMFVWQLQTPLRQLYKWVGGTGTVLASDNIGYVKNTWYNVNAGSFNGNLTVSVNGSEIFNVMDNTFTSGRTGLFCRGNQNSYYDNVLIQCAVDDSVEVRNDTVHGGQTECFEATDVVTLGGDGASFVVESGGIADVIAGKRIVMLPVTKAEAGAYLHARISGDGFYCNNPLTRSSLKDDEMAESTEPHPENGSMHGMRIYPNPTTGLFTLEVSGGGNEEDLSVEVFNLFGRLITACYHANGNRIMIDLSGQSGGIYLVKAKNGSMVVTGKIVLQK